MKMSYLFLALIPFWLINVGALALAPQSASTPETRASVAAHLSTSESQVDTTVHQAAQEKVTAYTLSPERYKQARDLGKIDFRHAVEGVEIGDRAAF
jgi:hypothetical protein